MTIRKKLKSIKPRIVIFWVLIICAPEALVQNIGAVENDTAPEYLIKAAYLYKYCFFVTWPDSKLSSVNSDEPVTIGLLGKAPFGNHFNPIEGSMIKHLNKKVKIKRFGQYRQGINLEGCWILYIDSSEKKNLKKIFQQINGKAVFTVGDMNGFLADGGMINLVHVGHRIRWEINLPAIEKSGLSISSTIVQSAVNVIP